MANDHPTALSAAEWNGVLHQKDGLAHLREQFGKLPFSAHAIAALLLYEHTLVRPGDLRRLDAAFFTMNGVISVAFFVFVLADVL